MSGRRSKWSITSELSLTSMRLVVSTNKKVRRPPNKASNKATNNIKIPRTSKASMLRCPITLSMIIIVIKGLTKPNTCTKNEEIKTSINTVRCSIKEGTNHQKLNFSFCSVFGACSSRICPDSPQISWNSPGLRRLNPDSGLPRTISCSVIL